jgi:type IV pilus biogenesis protein CpaD/CtpE
MRAVIVALLLSGCALTPPKVVTEVKTVEISVPTRVPCLSAEQIPKKPARVISPQADIRGLSAGAVAELRAWEGYYLIADALLKSCM